VDKKLPLSLRRVRIEQFWNLSILLKVYVGLLRLYRYYARFTRIRITVSVYQIGCLILDS